MSSDFEDELRRALKRVEPPDRFVERVMKRTAVQAEQKQ